MHINWFKRGMALVLALILTVPAAAFALEEPAPATVEEVQSACVDEPVDELPEMSLTLPEGLETEDMPIELPLEEPSEAPLETPLDKSDDVPAEESGDESSEATVISGFTFPEDISMPQVFLSAEGECSHWYNKMTFVTFGKGRLSDIKKYENCDSETHWAIGDIYRMTQCFDCGATIEHTLLVKNGRVKQRHTSFNNKTCSKCKTKLNTKTVTEIRDIYLPYEGTEKAVHDGDTATHLWTGNLIRRTYKIDPLWGESCDLDLDVILEADVQWREQHTMNGKYCTSCDYVAAITCTHKNLEIRPFYYNWPHSAEQDEFQHRYLGDWAEELYCADCGIQLSTHPETGADYPMWYFGDDVLQDHEYINGVCDDCGHKAAFTLSDKSLKLGIGEKYTLGYAFENALGTTDVTFSTSKSSIAAVNKTTGEITAKKTGSATITAKATNGRKVTCKVTVGKKPTSIKFNKTEVLLGVGETFQLTAKLSSKSYSRIQWTVESENTAVIMGESGTMVANEQGTATITATTYNGKSAQCIVTVKAAPTDADIGIALDKAVIGTKEVIYAHAGMAEDCAGTITFSVDGSAAAIDSGTGKITGKSAGTVTVRAEAYNGASATAQLEVKPAPGKIRITNAPKKMGVGQKHVLDVKIGADGEDCAGSWTFSSSNKKIATVNKTTGEVTAKKTGTVKITVTSHHSKKVKHTVTIKVYKKPSSVKLNKTTVYLGIGETYDLDAKLSSGSYSPVTWTTSYENDPAVVDSSGLVTGMYEGSTFVTATLYNGKSAVCEVIVGFAPERVEFGFDSMVLHAGQKETFVAYPVSSNGTAYGKVTYKSSNKSVATVSSSGKITAKKSGLVTITAQAYTGEAASYELMVLPAVKSVKINIPSRIPAGSVYGYDPETGAYTDFGIFDYISVSPNSTGITGISVLSITSIKSSKTSVADVGYLEEDGMPVLVAFKKGKFTMTVKTYNGKSAKKTITVY